MTNFKLDDVIENDKFKGKTVREIIKENRKNFIKLVKEGMVFDDEVCEFAGYSKSIRNEEVNVEFIDRSKIVKDNKKYTKDTTEKVKKFLQEISILDKDNELYMDKDNEDNDNDDDV